MWLPLSSHPTAASDGRAGDTENTSRHRPGPRDRRRCGSRAGGWVHRIRRGGSDRIGECRGTGKTAGRRDGDS
jgi:hypothetical protein